MSLLQGFTLAMIGLILAICPMVRRFIRARDPAEGPPNRHQPYDTIDRPDFACVTLAETQSALILWK